jgi:hypothetical protein
MKIALLVGLLFINTSFATDIPSDPHIYDQPGPHGGKIVKVHHRTFEVSRKATKKMLDVYMPKSEGAPPKDLQMTLLKSGKTDQTLMLKPVPSVDTNVVPNEESQAALGFTFDLDPKKKDVQ